MSDLSKVLNLRCIIPPSSRPRGRLVPKTGQGLEGPSLLGNFSAGESQHGEVDVLGVPGHVDLALLSGVLQEALLAVKEKV